MVTDAAVRPNEVYTPLFTPTIALTTFIIVCIKRKQIIRAVAGREMYSILCWLKATIVGPLIIKDTLNSSHLSNEGSAVPAT